MLKRVFFFGIQYQWLEFALEISSFNINDNIPL